MLCFVLCIIAKSPHAGDWIETKCYRENSGRAQVPSRRGLDRNKLGEKDSLWHPKSPHAGDWIETGKELKNG